MLSEEDTKILSHMKNMGDAQEVPKGFLIF